MNFTKTLTHTGDRGCKTFTNIFLITPKTDS